MKLMVSALVLGGVLAGCALLNPPPSFTSENTPANSSSRAQEAPPPPAPASQPGQPPGAQVPTPTVASFSDSASARTTGTGP